MLSSSHHQIITDYWTELIFSSGGTVVSHILDVCDGTKTNALSGQRGSELSDGRLLLDERRRQCFWCRWRCVSVVGGFSQTSVPSVGAFTLSSGTNKKIPVKFSCSTLLWAAEPWCRMWRCCDETCSRRRRVCLWGHVCAWRQCLWSRGQTWQLPRGPRAESSGFIWPLTSESREADGTPLARGGGGRRLWEKKKLLPHCAPDAFREILIDLRSADWRRSLSHDQN